MWTAFRQPDSPGRSRSSRRLCRLLGSARFLEHLGLSHLSISCRWCSYPGPHAVPPGIPAGLLIDGILIAVGLLVTGLLAYLPFYIGFRSQAAGFLPNVVNPTRLRQFFVMFGPFLFLLGFWQLMVARRMRIRWRTALAAAAGLLALLVLASIILGAGALLSPEIEGVLDRLTVEVGGTGPALRQALPIRLTNSWTTLFLIAVIGLVIGLWRSMLIDERPQPGHSATAADDNREHTVSPFALLLVLTAALLTLAPEYVYLRDNFGPRLNTVFKFYYQAWVLFALASAFALYSLLRQRAARPLESPGSATRYSSPPVLSIPRWRSLPGSTNMAARRRWMAWRTWSRPFPVTMPPSVGFRRMCLAHP